MTRVWRMRSWFQVCVWALAASAWVAVARAQDDAAPAAEPEGYQFTEVHRVECTPVKSQDNTGTCWCFGTASFIESEILRLGKGSHNVSEMFVVRNVYLEKARNYLLRHGKTNFDEGALAHDCLAAVKQHGLVPEEVFSGLLEGATRHDHGEMVAVLKGMVEAFIQRSRPSARWDDAIGSVLDVYLGEAPPEFSYQDQSFTATSFAAHVGFDPDQYVGLTSYTHHPFGESFVLEVPDNSSSGAFVNRPIDDLLEIVDRSLAAGFSVVWDGDVSERGFQARNGIAVWPAEGNSDFATRPGDEAAVTQEQRQASLEDFSTGEEHLMHLVGTARDQRGTKYYIIKNSWGEVGDHKGFLYMSENYFRAKTVAITVHRDALDAESATRAPASGSGATSSSSSGTSQR